MRYAWQTRRNGNMGLSILIGSGLILLLLHVMLRVAEPVGSGGPVIGQRIFPEHPGTSSIGALVQVTRGLAQLLPVAPSCVASYDAA
jgi:hypothetical protein